MTKYKMELSLVVILILSIFTVIILSAIGKDPISTESNGDLTANSSTGGHPQDQFTYLPGDVDFDLKNENGKPKVVFVYTNPTEEEPHV